MEIKLKKYFMLFSTLLIISSSSLIAQDKGFGLGIIVGEPTGVSGKLWLGGNNALDMATAWSFKGSGSMLLQADYIWHTFNLIRVSSGKLPLYFGIGGRVIFGSKDTYFGARIPVGLNYIFSGTPLDIFVEIVPILDLAPSTDFDIGGGLGIRFWF
jgi:hypothetical protein